ncbi:hypothetical protein HK101_004914 [Irineochytrium annulatum]|nr:hypothetical protein HK101_004914 [Irineochytrium annulatum]
MASGIMNFDEDLMQTILSSLDPTCASGRFALYAGLFVSFGFFRMAAPALWSAYVEITLTGMSMRGKDRAIPAEVLRRLFLQRLLIHLKPGSREWRWRIYLRSIRELRFHVNADPTNGAKLHSVMMLGPLLAPGFDAIYLSKWGRANAVAEGEACYEAWSEWILNRLENGMTVRLLTFDGLTHEEMDRFAGHRITNLEIKETEDLNFEQLLSKFKDIKGLKLGYAISETCIERKVLSDVAKFAEKLESFNFQCFHPDLSEGLMEDCVLPPMSVYTTAYADHSDLAHLSGLSEACKLIMRSLDLNFRAPHDGLTRTLLFFTGLTSLTLTIRTNAELSELPSAIAHLQKLREFRFTNLHSDPVMLDGAVSNLPNLRYLSICGADATSCNVAVGFGLQLKVLSVTCGVLVINKQEIAWSGMPHLEELVLSQAAVITTVNIPFERRLEEMILDRAVTPALSVVVWRKNDHEILDLEDWKSGRSRRCLV